MPFETLEAFPAFDPVQALSLGALKDAALHPLVSETGESGSREVSSLNFQCTTCA